MRTTSIVIWEVLFCTLYLEMAPKGNVRRVTGNRDVATRFIESRGNFKIFLQLLENMVAKDGAEAPTPAFSGPILNSDCKYFT